MQKSRHTAVFLVVMILLAACGKTEYKQGQNLYTQYCANCHMDTGRGLGKLIPLLANADWLKNNQEQLACIIHNGMEGPIVVNDTTYNQVMAGIPTLSEFQITNIINYINHAWGNNYGVGKLGDVRKALAGCP